MTDISSLLKQRHERFMSFERMLLLTTRRIWSQGELSQLFQERSEEASDAVWGQSSNDVRRDPERATEKIVTEFGFSLIEIDLSKMTRSEMGAALLR